MCADKKPLAYLLNMARVNNQTKESEVMAMKKEQCGCAFEINKLKNLVKELDKRLNTGRQYLMTVYPDKLTVEDALEAFGWQRNGLD